MTQSLEYERVYNELVSRAMAGTFHPVTIDPTTKLAMVDTGTNIAPAAALANEIEASFGDNPVDRQKITDHRTRWAWDLLVHFDQHVTCERFEQSLITPPVRLVGNPTTGQRLITLHLKRAEYQHPQQQQQVTGTKAKYRFEASLSPL